MLKLKLVDFYLQSVGDTKIYAHPNRSTSPFISPNSNITDPKNSPSKSNLEILLLDLKRKKVPGSLTITTKISNVQIKENLKKIKRHIIFASSCINITTPGN